MSTGLEQLQPARVWKLFGELSAIPRPSEREEGVRQWLLGIAKSHNWGATVDGAGNVLLRVPATKGREKAPITILQAHMDMVTIKAPGSKHDFDRDPILAHVTEHRGEPVVAAQGTTLGADNGMGLCAAVAAATEATHGPLEILTTVNEETGMSGAHGLDASLLRGRRLVNLDSEEDDAIYVGCVGGASGWLTWETKDAAPAGWEAVLFKVEGLRGGHSGLEIHESRGSANRILARMLTLLPRGKFALADFDGGSRTNAIAAEAHATVLVSPEVRTLTAPLAHSVEEETRVTLGPFGTKVKISAAPAQDAHTRAFPPEASFQIANAISLLPHGVLARETDDPSVLESSANLATIRTTRESDWVKVVAEISIRSLRQNRLEEIVAFLEKQAREWQAAFRGKYRYPPWTPQPESALLATTRETYAKLFGVPPRIAVIHGGLETGIIGSKIPEIEMVSIGPRIEEPHTPEERVYVRSVEKFWELLKALLEELSRG